MTRGAKLFPYSLFAGVLAMAGLPIYIHAPKVYVDDHGVGLAALGAVLFGLRLLDVVQDPALGWLAHRLRHRRGASVALTAAIMALAMVALFAVPPPIAPLAWFALSLAALFSSFSFLTICFYAQGVGKAETLGPGGHVQLAGWRETGALAGVSLAAVAPVALLGVTDSPFALFAAGFAGLTGIAVLAMRREWRARELSDTPGFRDILADATLRRLLAIAFTNAAPVAVTSTLFLFFVDSKLALSGWEGALLLLFFLSAALSAPLWARIAQRIGAKPALQAAMVLAIVSFAAVPLLQPGDLAPFALICLVSGAALGADLTLLPALFATRAATVAPEASAGFGLWSFVSKATLALAAATLLPLLEAAGFDPGAAIDAKADTMLTTLYAGIPCALKLAALALLTLTTLDTAPQTQTLKEA